MIKLAPEESREKARRHNGDQLSSSATPEAWTDKKTVVDVTIDQSALGSSETGVGYGWYVGAFLHFSLVTAPR